MSLYIDSLHLRSFRNFPSFNLGLKEGINILVGPNAVGKTNTLEALQLLTSGNSFRHPTSQELIHEGSDKALISSVLKGDKRHIDISCEISNQRRVYTRNGKRVTTSSMVGTLPSILFNPDNLSLIKGSASQRRQEIDQFASQINSSYRRILTTYTKSIEQRNHLLKEGLYDYNLLDVWDESIAVGGATLLHARLRLFERLSHHIQDMYQTISPYEELTCSYICKTVEHPFDLSRDDIAHFILLRLQERRQEDLIRGSTSIGPHRDDISFSINGREVRSFGSQGQQRSIVLALKMAEVILSKELTQKQPLLLLDDVMSELDTTRRKAVLRLTTNDIQTVITTTTLDYFSSDVLLKAEVIDYGK